MKRGIVACPVHGDNETTRKCPDCRDYNQDDMKIYKTCDKKEGIHLWTSLNHCMCGQLQWGKDNISPHPKKEEVG